MQTNTTKARLKAGETVLGCFVRTPDPGLVEFIAYLGWDFLVFDGEHGTIDPNRCEDMVRAALLRGVTPIVRATTNQAPVILRYMDTGAHGVHIPWVNSGAEAEAAVQAVKYWPRGQRGLAGTTRAASYGQVMSLAEYVRAANAETLTVVHIETAEAVERIDEILAVEGVDVVFLGPTDLSHSYGFPGDPSQPVVQQAMDRVIEAARRANVAIGTLVRDADGARAWRERGAQYITTTMELILAPACRAWVAGARGEASNE